jgi:thymidylate kinase
VIIELAGPPGVGKSTAIRRLVAAYPEWERQVIRQSLWVFPSHPAATARAIAHWVPPCARWEQPFAAMQLARRRVNQDILARFRRAPLVLEEGVIHHLWRGLFLRPAWESEAWQPLVANSVPVVALQLVDDTLFERVANKERAHPVSARLATQGPDSDDWRRARALYSRVLAEAERTRRVVRVPASGGPDELARAIRDAAQLLLQA